MATESDGDNVAKRFFTYGYDSLDKIVSYEETDNGTIKQKETYVYDAYGKVTEVKYEPGFTYAYTYEDETSDTIESISVGENIRIKPKTDVNGRVNGKKIFVNNVGIAEEKTDYRKVGDHATNMPGTIWFGSTTNGRYAVDESVRYAYDKMGNIDKIYHNGELAVRYRYDSINRLIREDNKILDKTNVFVYDNNGNVLKKREFSKFTLKDDTLIEELESTDKEYVYEGDKMLSYDGKYCVYDAMGNSTVYCGKPAVWSNGRLSSYDGHNFEYDAQGRRLSKDEIIFTYDSKGKLIRQSNGLEFFYDHSGISGVKQGETTYFYRKDGQGNVVALINESGVVVARYIYDAWGNTTVVNNDGTKITNVTHIGIVNPFRFRSYYFDTETDLYFLKTRYYDPKVGRFISADSIEYIDPERVNGLNLYAYCNDNPIMNVDPDGTSVLSVIGLLYLFLCTAVGGVLTQFISSTITYASFAIVSLFDPDIEADMDRISWNPFNTNEDLVLSSNKVSFYKGVPVVNYSQQRACFASVIFLADWIREEKVVNELRHEWGHLLQLVYLGPFKYAITECIPSVFQWGPWAKDGRYYDSPVETIADMFGGAFDYGNHFHTEKQKQVAVERLFVARYFGVLSYLYFL